MWAHLLRTIDINLKFSIFIVKFSIFIDGQQILKFLFFGCGTQFEVLDISAVTVMRSRNKNEESGDTDHYCPTYVNFNRIGIINTYLTIFLIIICALQNKRRIVISIFIVKDNVIEIPKLTPIRLVFILTEKVFKFRALILYSGLNI